MLEESVGHAERGETVIVNDRPTIRHAEEARRLRADSTAPLPQATRARRFHADEHSPRSRVQQRRQRRHSAADKASKQSTFLSLLLLGQLFCEPLTLQTAPSASHRLSMDSATAPNMRKLFDPMVGDICVDMSSKVLSSLFQQKFRYRDDAQLARYAWNQQHPYEVNMMMTEAPLRSTGGPRAADPSLLDYDAIDQSWRRDIEQEKGAFVEPLPQSSCSGQGCSSQQLDPANDQFQRDLQILTEKSLFAPLSAEEAYRYENLSKAHYADFYLSVPISQKSRTDQNETFSYSNLPNSTLEWLSTSDMKQALTDLGSSDFFNPAESDKPEQLQTYSNLTLCDNQGAVMNNDANLSGTTPVEPEKPQEAEPQKPQQSSDEFNGLETLSFPDTDPGQLLNNTTIRHDLQDAFWLHEFDGMEMLGEFNHFGEEQRPEKMMQNVVPLPNNYEEVRTCQDNRDTSPSSGIGSMRSSGSSPSQDGSDHENQTVMNSRIYNKLAPLVARHPKTVSTSSETSTRSYEDLTYSTRGPIRRRLHDLHSFNVEPRPLSIQNGGVQQRKRGRQSKDEQLAYENGLPASAEEFAAMTHMEIQRFMRDPTLSQTQKQLIKKIRRRGRNKVAARKCRERRVTPEDGPQSPMSSHTDVVQTVRRISIAHDPSRFSLYNF